MDGVIIKFRNVNQYENNLFLDNVNISSDATTYITQQESVNTIEIYPNPTDQFIHIHHDGLKEIYTILGEKILVTHKNTINVSFLANGIYLIKVNNQTMRLIKN